MGTGRVNLLRTLLALLVLVFALTVLVVATAYLAIVLLESLM